MFSIFTKLTSRMAEHMQYRSVILNKCMEIGCGLAVILCTARETVKKLSNCTTPSSRICRMRDSLYIVSQVFTEHMAQVSWDICAEAQPQKFCSLIAQIYALVVLTVQTRLLLTFFRHQSSIDRSSMSVAGFSLWRLGLAKISPASWCF